MMVVHLSNSSHLQCLVIYNYISVGVGPFVGTCACARLIYVLEKKKLIVKLENTDS